MSDHLDEKTGQLAEHVDSADDLEKTGNASKGPDERSLMYVFLGRRHFVVLILPS
jgi:hypothetical protein